MENNPLQPVVSLLESISPIARLELLLLIVAGEWCLVCLAFNLKRLHTLFLAHALY